MFEPQPGPRLFALPPGVDFPARLAAGLKARVAGQPPEALARTEVIVNSQRMRRRLTDCLAADGALLLPRIRLVTDLGHDPEPGLPPPISPLRRRLELAQLILRLLAAEPELAPRSAAFALADSLAGLMDEMAGEGVGPGALARLDLGDLSGHWDRSRKFLTIVEAYLAEAPPDAEGRRRQVAERLAARWRSTPPDHPVIVAGSTGSRGASRVLMAAAARLPQGAVVLPGFDFDLPGQAWGKLTAEDGTPLEDHPQKRLKGLLDDLDLSHEDVLPWDDLPPANASRNALISLALRPAPATDAWLDEGPGLKGLKDATESLALIEAPDPRAEAAAIALALRGAAEAGHRAALFTPDRTLARRVTAELDRWGIAPDDSAGRPLTLSPPGRFLMQVAALAGRPPASEAVLAILKHPLAAAGGGPEPRGEHLRHTRDLELHLRRRGHPFPGPEGLRRWAEAREDRAGWAAWLARCLDGLGDPAPRPLADLVAAHLALAGAFAAGPGGEDHPLWAEAAGEEARAAMDELTREAPHGGDLAPADYLSLLRTLFEARQVRRTEGLHPGISILGPREAREAGVDLAILAGLNEGTWPGQPPPDPWMNRRMRLDAGLLLPERRIGLQAHDFQIAVAAPRVILSRSLREDEAECVPARWLNRVTTLMQGIEPGALAEMRVRGAGLVAQAGALAAPTDRLPAAPRPSPRPPVAARPRALSVTEIQTLIRDPYAIYARHVLGLRKLDPLRPAPDARLRGSVLHRVFELFLRGGAAPDDAAAFAEVARRVLEADAPWPAARAAWQARLDRIAPWFLAGEADRRRSATPAVIEGAGVRSVGATGVVLKGKADRIDLGEDGRALVYDYKTGKPPGEKEQKYFDKQLPLLAALAEGGAFAALGPAEVAEVAHIALTASPEVKGRALEPGEADQVWEELARLLSAYGARSRGYASRRAARNELGPGSSGDYDHLARYGEWEGSDPAPGEDVGEDVAEGKP